MRSILGPILALTCLFGAMSAATAGSYQGNGIYAGTPSPAVTAMFAAYPNGGDALVAAIRDLLIANPALADDVAYVGSGGNAGQQLAAGAGLAQAYTVLINRGDNDGAGRIVGVAQQSTSPTIQTAVTRAIGSTIGANSYQYNGTTITSTNCSQPISPSQPSTCQ